MYVLRRANTQEDLKAVAGSTAVVSVEFFRPKVYGELTAQSDVNVVAA